MFMSISELYDYSGSTNIPDRDLLTPKVMKSLGSFCTRNGFPYVQTGGNQERNILYPVKAIDLWLKHYGRRLIKSHIEERER